MNALTLFLLIAPAAAPEFAPPKTAAELQRFMVGDWKMEAREDDLIMSIDYLTWRAQGVDGEGKPIRPSQAALEAERKENLARRVAERAAGAELAHRYYSDDGRVFGFSRATAKDFEPSNAFDARFTTEVKDGKFFIIHQKGKDQERTEIQILDANRYRIIQMGTKLPLPVFSFTYKRMSGAPEWCEFELEDALEETKAK